MGIISRVTEFVGGTKAKASEVNAELDRIHGVINGSIDNANIATTPKIVESKIDDISSSGPDSRSDVTPGNSAIPSLPTDLEGELRRIRYRLRKGSVGIAAEFWDNTATELDCGWQESVIVGPNLLTNPSFEYHTKGANNEPDGWALVGTPALSTQATAATEGKGNDVLITAGAVAQEGIQQTVTEIKGSRLYLVGCRAKEVVNDFHLEVTGGEAAGFYQNFDITTDSLTYVTLSAVVVATAVPADIIVNILTDGLLNDSIRADHAFMYELGDDPLGYDYSESVSTVTETTDTATATVTAGNTSTFLSTTVSTLSDRPSQIVVDAFLNVFHNGSQAVIEASYRLEANIDAAGWNYLTGSRFGSATSGACTVPIHHVVDTSATSLGESWEFRIEVENEAGSGGIVYINRNASGAGTLIAYESSMTVEVRPKL